MGEAHPTVHRITERVAELLADGPTRRLIAALADGRSLPVSLLGTEAGLSPSTTRRTLGEMDAAGLLTTERFGRRIAYALSDEARTAVHHATVAGPPLPLVASLRPGTRAARHRAARSCYGHLAGRLGVALMRSLLEAEVLVATDGITNPRRRDGDGLATPRVEHPYVLGQRATDVLEHLGVPPSAITDARAPSALRVCVDGTEQHHHLAGRLGSALLASLLDRGWLVRAPGERALTLTASGQRGLLRCLPLTAAEASTESFPSPTHTDSGLESGVSTLL